MVVDDEPAPPRFPMRFVYLIDTSGSMEGRPAGSGSENIFPEVKTALKTLARNMLPGDSADVFTFHEGIRSHETFGSGEINAAVAHIDGLAADGNTTCVYESTLSAADTVRQALAASPETPFRTVFFVFTDGEDESHQDKCSGGVESMEVMLSQYAGLRRHDDILLYAKLGKGLSSTDLAALDTVPFAHHVHDPHRDFLFGVVSVETPEIDFGEVKHDPSAPDSIVLVTRMLQPADLTVTVEARFPSVDTANARVAALPDSHSISVPGQVHHDTLSLQLEVAERGSLSREVHEGKVGVSVQSDGLSADRQYIVVVPETAKATFEYTAWPWWWWLAALGVALPITAMVLLKYIKTIRPRWSIVLDPDGSKKILTLKALQTILTFGDRTTVWQNIAATFQISRSSNKKHINVKLLSTNQTPLPIRRSVNGQEDVIQPNTTYKFNHNDLLTYNNGSILNILFIRQK